MKTTAKTKKKKTKQKTSKQKTKKKDEPKKCFGSTDDMMGST